MDPLEARAARTLQARQTLRRAATPRAAAALAVALLLAAGSAVGEVRLSHELHVAGISHHFSPPAAYNRSWNESHDGFGVQRTRLEQGWIRRWSAGFMRDSHGKQGLYAGYAWARHTQWHEHGVDLGLAPMLLWRTTRFDSLKYGPARHTLVPALMPMLSYQHRPTGFGANLSAVPEVRLGGDSSYPALVFLQFTQRLP